MNPQPGGTKEPEFYKVGTAHELCRFPSGEWSLRFLVAGDPAHVRYLHEHEVDMVEGVRMALRGASKESAARDRVIEECANVCMEHVGICVAYGEGEKARTAATLADTIRALKSDQALAVAPQESGYVRVRRELLERVNEALQRFLDDRAPRRIPVDPADADLVQHEIKLLLPAAHDGKDQEGASD